MVHNQINEMLFKLNSISIFQFCRMVRLGSTPVLDIGTFSAKVGFAGETYPVLLVTHEQFYPWPVQRGRITDWNALEEVTQEIAFTILLIIVLLLL